VTAVTEPRTWTLTFAAPAPWINANKRYKRRPSNDIRTWRQSTNQYAASGKLPRDLAQIEVDAEVRFPADGRRRDAHNYFPTIKACVDGLVDYGLIPNDHREHLKATSIVEGDPLPRRRFQPPGEITLTIREVA
jgi:hypothetical protein